MGRAKLDRWCMQPLLRLYVPSADAARSSAAKPDENAAPMGRTGRNTDSAAKNASVISGRWHGN